MDTRPSRAPSANPLTGRFFHSRDRDGAVEWQGQVVAEISNGHFLIQLHEPGGAPGDQQVVHVARMRDWTFYKTRDEWLAASRRLNGGAA